MRPSWTRRRFLLTVVGGAAVARAAARSLAATPAVEKGVSSRGLNSAARATLQAAMDEIIPAADGMPAASEAGAMGYLEHLAGRDPGVRRDLLRAAAALEKTARSARFASLPASRRVQALAALEKKEPALFATLRDTVYEGYYTQPEVWRRLGFEFYGPERPGPGLAPFDENAVEKMRERPPLYRKVAR